MKRVVFALFALFAALAAPADANLRTRVELATEPKGATIFIDGANRGITPTYLYDVKPGRHRFRFQLAGYEDFDAYYQVDAGVPLQRAETLAPVKGILLLRSEPDGCKITIDGISCGETPRLITHLDAKDAHKVALEKTGYRPSSFEVRFNGRTPVVRAERMVLDSAILRITTEPAGATVIVNGQERGVTPLEVREVPKGRATVRLRYDGFAEEVREIGVNAGEEQELNVALKGLPGTLSLTSVPEGARFYLNGTPYGKSPTVIQNLAPGDYEVRAELEGYGDYTETLKLENGASLVREFRLSNVMGRIEVRTTPPGAKVFIDGKNVGTTTAGDPNAETSDVLPIENVMEGDHVLVMKRDGYVEVTGHAKVQSCKTSKVRVQLKRIFMPNIEIVTDQGSYKGVFLKREDDSWTIEVSLGVERTFRQSDIREIRQLKR